MEDASESVVGFEGSIDGSEWVTAWPAAQAPRESLPTAETHPIGDSPDETVVSSAIDGNSDAFDVLFRRYHSLALRTAAAILGADLAEDVVQDAFLLAFLALPMIRDRSKFPRWLSTITRFRALRLRRSEGYRRTGAIALDAARLATLSNIVCAPREEMEGDDLLRSALDRIPPEYAEVLRLHFLHGMPHQKIAEFLAVPVSTVKWRCFRGKQMVRCIVRPEGCEPKRVAETCQECPSRAAWCSDKSKPPLRITRTAAMFTSQGAAKPVGNTKKTYRKRKMALGVTDLAVWSTTLFPVSRAFQELLPDMQDFLSDVLPDVLPDLMLDVLPDFLSDVLALLNF